MGSGNQRGGIALRHLQKPLRLISIDVETGAVLESKTSLLYSDKAPHSHRGPTSFQLNKDTLFRLA